MATGTRKRTTAADVAAAVRLGVLAPDAEYVTAADADAAIERAELDPMATARTNAQRAAGLSSTDHGCTLPGCRHGAAHGPTQPDRQIKLQCATCNAVVRLTARALAVSGGISDTHGALAPAARRTYVRKSA